MQYRRMGRTGLDVSLLSLGTGGARQLGQKTGMTQAEQTRFVRHGLDLGVNFIDTSSDYGESEVILGKALKGVPRDSYYLCTKWPAYDGMEPTSNPALLVESFESSLRRLDTDYVEVMMFHGPLASHYDNIVEHLYPDHGAVSGAGQVRVHRPERPVRLRPAAGGRGRVREAPPGALGRADGEVRPPEPVSGERGAATGDPARHRHHEHGRHSSEAARPCPSSRS